MAFVAMSESTQLPDPAPRFLWPTGLLVVSLCLVPIFQCKRALDDLGDWPTQNVLVKETPSPDGRLRLVEYIRRTGASSTDTREFSVLDAKQPLPDDDGNAFRLNAQIPGFLGFPESRPSPVSAKWIQVDHVEIAYPEGVKVVGAPARVELSVDGTRHQVDISAHPFKPAMKRRSAGSVNQN